MRPLWSRLTLALLAAVFVLSAAPASAGASPLVDPPPTQPDPGLFVGTLPDTYVCFGDGTLPLSTSVQFPGVVCNLPSVIGIVFSDLSNWFRDQNASYCANGTTGFQLWLNESGLDDVPVLGSALSTLVTGINRIVCPAVDWVFSLAWTIGEVATGYISNAVFLGLRGLMWPGLWLADKIFDLAVLLGTWLYWVYLGIRDVYDAIKDFGINAFDGLLDLIVYPEDVSQLQLNLVAIGGTSSTIGGSLGDAVQSIDFRPLEPGEGCVSVAGADICPVDFATGINANSSPWSYLSALWVGFWAVFSTVVAIGSFARMTDS